MFVWSVALPAAATPRHAPAHRPPSTHLAIAGRDRQSARAYAASTGPGYETAFPQSLVVRVPGGPRHAKIDKLRYACVERDCRFALAEEGDDVTRVDTRSYDVKVVDGRATLPLTLSTDRVPGVFHVRVRPSDARVRDASAPNVVFTLSAR